MIVNKYQSGGGSGSGYTLPVATQSTLGGVKIGSGITIDSGGTISVSGGTAGGPTVIDFDAMTQQELAAFSAELRAVWSGTSVNGQYVFLKSYGDYTPENAGTRQFRLQMITVYDTTIKFGAAVRRPDSDSSVLSCSLDLYSDGTYSHSTHSINSMEKGTEAIGYFNNFNNYIVYNKGNNTFTDKDGNALTNGGNFGGSVYWFVMHPIQGDWGNGIATLPFKVIDANSAETMHYYASVEMEALDTPITIDGVEYTEKFAFKYPDFTFSGYVNSTPNYANLTFAPENGGQGGGIQKVNELPASAETGDVVWLNGKSYTGYTILCATDARPAYVYELDRSNVAIDGDETSMRMGDFVTGAWVSWGGVMVRPRVQETTDYPLLDVIDSGGTHTITVGANAISMETGVTFPMKGCLYEYRADGWFRKARFEHIYEGAADGLALIQKIQYGIEEFGFEDFVLRFSPDINGEREFVPYCSTNYGVDFQATDSRNKEQNWGRISCRDYRLSPSDGSFQDMVGQKWIVSEDQIDIPQIESVYINSAGTITEHYGLGLLSSMFNVSNRVCFHCNLEADNKFSSAPLKWWYRQNEQIDGDTKLVYYACAEIPIEGTVYKGVWKWVEYQYPDPFVPQSWTAVQ